MTTGRRGLAAGEANVEAKGHLPLLFYPEFLKEDDPLSGFKLGVTPARYSEAYWGLNNRIGVLVETHSWKPYDVRVRATDDAVLSLMEVAAQEAGEWSRAARQADDEGRAIGGKEVVLRYQATKNAKTIDFPGYKFERRAFARFRATVYEIRSQPAAGLEGAALLRAQAEPDDHRAQRRLHRSQGICGLDERETATARHQLSRVASGDCIGRRSVSGRGVPLCQPILRRPSIINGEGKMGEGKARSPGGIALRSHRPATGEVGPPTLGARVNGIVPVVGLLQHGL